MTIRYRLLFSHLLISLISSLFITSMFFVHFSTIITNEIKHKIEIESLSMMQEIDWHLFERIQNIIIWQDLEVMQDIRVNDIDKRLASFLRQMTIGYHGIYQFLLTMDKQNKIIASSHIPFHHAIPNIHQAFWQTTQITGKTIYIQADIPENNFFYLATPILDQFQPDILGYLYAAVDWEGINHILETPLPFLHNNQVSYALVVDQNNHIIATSEALRNAGLLYTTLSKNLQIKGNNTAVQTVTLSFLGTDTWLVAQSVSTGHRSYKGLGWKVLVMQPADHALQPAYSIWQILLIFIIFTTIIATILSFWSAQRIAKPIMQLAKFTRNYMLDTEQKPPKIHASGEIFELNKQFNKMIAYLEQSQKDKIRMAKFATIAEMAATMAHEIRTPLGILRSSAQMLSREKNISPIAQEMLGFIKSETTRLNDLVTTLLNSSQTRELHFVQHDMTMVIEHMLELLRPMAEKKQIQISFKKPNNPCIIAYDWDQMLQVFLNLVVNAIQHTPETGMIRITLSNEISKVVILISDNGSGISDKNKAHIFDPFFTQRQDGIGLGLMVVQQTIQAHQGKIEVSDSPSGGACFTIQIPKNKEEL